METKGRQEKGSAKTVRDLLWSRGEEKMKTSPVNPRFIEKKKIQVEVVGNLICGWGDYLYYEKNC